MQRRKTLFATAGYGLVLAGFIALHAGPGWTEENGNGGKDAPVEPAAATAPAPVAAQGLQIYRDPQSGRIGPPPPGAKPLKLNAAERRMLSHSDQALPRPRSLPGGGVAVDLQGRFRTMAVATVGSGGKAAVGCALTPGQAEGVMRAGQPAADGPER
jgi:hypothetical protein